MAACLSLCVPLNAQRSDLSPLFLSSLLSPLLGRHGHFVTGNDVIDSQPHPRFQIKTLSGVMEHE